MGFLVIIAGLLGGMVGLFFIVNNPFIGLFLFTVMLYVKPGIFGAIFATLHITRLVGALTFVIFLFKSRKSGGIKFFNAVQSKWLIVFGFVMCCSMTTSIWRGNTLGFLTGFLKVFIAYFLVVNLTSTLKRYRALVWAMVLSMVFIGGASIKDYYGGGAAADGGRMFGAFRGALFGDPNDLAMAFIMLVPFLYYDLFLGKGFLRKGMVVGIMGLFFGGIVLTQSRGGLIGMVVMLLFLWLRSKIKLRLAIIGLIVLAIGWQIAPQSYKDRMMSIQTAAETDNAAINRLDAWEAGWNMMTHRAVGVGVGNFGEGFFRYKPDDAIEAPGARQAAHNMFVQIGGETGFPGLIIFLFMLGVTFKALNRVKKNILKEGRGAKGEGREIVLLADATYVSLVGYCASGFFLSQGYNFILYYLIAFSVVLERLSSGYFDKIKAREKELNEKDRDKKEQRKWKSKAASAGLVKEDRG